MLSQSSKLKKQGRGAVAIWGMISEGLREALCPSESKMKRAAIGYRIEWASNERAPTWLGRISSEATLVNGDIEWTSTLVYRVGSLNALAMAFRENLRTERPVILILLNGNIWDIHDMQKCESKTKRVAVFQYWSNPPCPTPMPCMRVMPITVHVQCRRTNS